MTSRCGAIGIRRPDTPRAKVKLLIPMNLLTLPESKAAKTVDLNLRQFNFTTYSSGKRLIIQRNVFCNFTLNVSRILQTQRRKRCFLVLQMM